MQISDCSSMCNSKIMAEKPRLVKMLLDLVSRLVNKSGSRRGSNTFWADQDNTETEYPESFEKLMQFLCFPVGGKL